MSSDMSGDNNAPTQQVDHPPFTKNVLEWGVFGISLALVLGLISLIIYFWAIGTGMPARIEVVAGDPHKGPGGWLVPVEVRNTGEGTAQQVRVRLEQGGVAGGEIEFDYMPRGAHVKGWIAIKGVPQNKEIRAVVVGYEEP